MLKITPINFQNKINLRTKTKKNLIKETNAIKCAPVSFGALGLYRTNIIHKQTIPEDIYFIRLNKYGCDLEWAREMKKATYKISEMISNKKDFYEVLEETENAIKTINTVPGFCGKAFAEINADNKIFNLHKLGRGQEYYKKYLDKLKNFDINEKYSPNSNEEYKDAKLCSIELKGDDYIFHNAVVINFEHKNKHNFDLMKKAYEKLISIEHPSDSDVIKTAAILQWLMAQDSPYRRGSDSVANLLTRSLMHAYGLKLTPLKNEISLDFEAFYTNLDDYIEKYPTFFEDDFSSN